MAVELATIKVRDAVLIFVFFEKLEETARLLQDGRHHFFIWNCPQKPGGSLTPDFALYGSNAGTGGADVRATLLGGTGGGEGLSRPAAHQGSAAGWSTGTVELCERKRPLCRLQKTDRLQPPRTPLKNGRGPVWHVQSPQRLLVRQVLGQAVEKGPDSVGHFTGAELLQPTLKFETSLAKSPCAGMSLFPAQMGVDSLGILPAAGRSKRPAKPLSRLTCVSVACIGRASEVN